MGVVPPFLSEYAMSDFRPLFRLQVGKQLVLASGSPRRQDFLREWGLPFSVVRPHGVEPHPVPGQTPLDYAVCAARAKAQAAWQGLDDASRKCSVVLAADTIVAIDNRILGKPDNEADALAMLVSLAGKVHDVITAVCLVAADDGNAMASQREICFSDTAKVHFHAWPRDVLAAYVATHEPDDKAGAYAIQGQGAFLVERVEGSWSTVVGLPLTPLARQLIELGVMMPVTTSPDNQAK